MTTFPEPRPNHTPNEEITRSYHIAMGEGQDWMSLPPASPFTAPELRLLAELTAGAVVTGPLMLELVGSWSDPTTALRRLLARVWAAGAKSGVAMAHAAAQPKDTPLFPGHTHTHCFIDTQDDSLCVTDMFCIMTYAEFRKLGYPS